MQAEIKLKIAFIKYAGMAIGGSELWLQKIATNLPKELFDIDFYYCDDSPYLGVNHVLYPSSEERINYLKKSGINVIKFTVGAKNIRSLTHDWVNTDFWEKFDESKYEIIQTVKAGPKEYPFYKIKKPVVEIVGLANRPDTSKNIAWSFHSSNWQRAQWIKLGGSVTKSSVLTAPVEKPQSSENYRSELGIPENALVAGFHQRNDDQIASLIPLLAFSQLEKNYSTKAKNWHFIIKNGGPSYRNQAKELGIKNIHFLGATPDSASVSKFLNTLDIFAHGRKDGETFGAVFIEAMMHGKPCLSHYSESGANAQPETMGPAGIFAYTLDEYGEKLFRLFDDADFRNNLASKAKPHAEKYYSIERCINEVVEVYTRITNKYISLHTDTHLKPISYGYSELGFLYAGDLEKESSIAHHVLIGGIPEPLNVTLLRAILPYTKTFLDIPNNSGLYGWVAADFYTKNSTQDASVTLYNINKNITEIVEAIRSLNKWETLVTLETKYTYLRPNDVIHIELPQESNISISVIQEMKNDCPLVVIRAQNDNTQILEAGLKNNYRVFISKETSIEEITKLQKNIYPSTFFLLHKEKHVKELQIINDTVKKYRNDAFVFRYIKKSSLKKIMNKIIPPYVTKDKLLSYLKRALHFN